MKIEIQVDTSRAQQAAGRMSEDLKAIAELLAEVCPHATIHVDGDALQRQLAALIDVRTRRRSWT